MTTRTSHIFRFSDSYELLCGAQYTLPEACDQVIECQECLSALQTKRESQATAARKVINASTTRQAEFANDFDIYD